MTDDSKECDFLIPSIKLMAEHLNIVADKLDKTMVNKMIDEVMNAENIFLMGAGRSGLVGKAFAMRLMHLGLRSYVVGESTTPAVEQNDVVIAISGSGETRSISNLGRITKEIGATLITVTSNDDSTLGRLADTVVVIPGRTKNDVGGYLERHMRGEYTHLTPLGTSFEISSLVFLDAVIAQMIGITGTSEAELKSRHAKLE